MIRAPLLTAAIVCVAGGASGGVPEPEDYRQDHYLAPVPETLAGALVLDDAAAHALWLTGDAAFIDVMPRPPRPASLPAGTIWRDKPRHSIPGAIWLPNVGYGVLHADTHAYFRAGLEAATRGDPSRPLVIFCRDECWMSWNAAKRALDYGYTDVRWYPAGSDGWTWNEWAVEMLTPFPPP